jgi:hypothetical protein
MFFFVFACAGTLFFIIGALIFSAMTADKDH